MDLFFFLSCFSERSGSVYDDMYGVQNVFINMTFIMYCIVLFIYNIYIYI